jgi:putative membrane protein
MKQAYIKKCGPYVISLLVLLIVIWGVLAINPWHRADWALENGLAIALVLVLVFTFKVFPLSRISYTMIFLFLTLHLIGAHYTYSEVPYNEWSEAVFGKSINSIFGWERNHFDRFVHFSYGLLLAYPIREFFLRIANVKGFWGYFFPLDITMSTSVMYELIEWGAAIFFGGALGAAYLGTQGDVWDAHKDMALATIGAILSMMITLIINLCLKHDFAREWNESLRIKHTDPLGEEAIVRMLNDNQKIQSGLSDET